MHPQSPVLYSETLPTALSTIDYCRIMPASCKHSPVCAVDESVVCGYSCRGHAAVPCWPVPRLSLALSLTAAHVKMRLPHWWPFTPGLTPCHAVFQRPGTRRKLLRELHSTRMEAAESEAKTSEWGRWNGYVRTCEMTTNYPCKFPCGAKYCMFLWSLLQ